jgi:hypothetical protein
MLPEEITDFRSPAPPCTDDRAQVFQSGDKGNDSGRWPRPILDQGNWGMRRSSRPPHTDCTKQSPRPPCGERSATARKGGCLVRGTLGSICITAKPPAAPHFQPSSRIAGRIAGRERTAWPSVSWRGARPPSLVGRPSVMPKRPNPTIAGGVDEANPLGMTLIYIFEENHRLSH